MDIETTRKTWRNWILGIEILLCLLQVAMAFGYGLGEKALGISAIWVPIPSYIGFPLFIVSQWFFGVNYKEENLSLSPLFPALERKKASMLFYIQAGFIAVAVIFMLLANGQVLPDLDKTYLLFGHLIVYPGLFAYIIMMFIPFFTGEKPLNKAFIIYIAYFALVVACMVLGFLLILKDDLGMCVWMTIAPLTAVLLLVVDPKAKSELDDEK